ncbi:MG2 domain-containing protein, partial [Cesiribacter andamanensis]|uniref:MG2 domain-containing protein n=1 Tax=Cesiribacter andamanensis TaxID=649507 RepID=UPI00058CCD2B
MRPVEQKFDRHTRQAVLEKLYVHTDRSFYLAGESMWYKVYAVNGSLHTPLDLSKVAYLEILDAQNKVVLQTKIALEAGTGKGSFYLPLSLSSGTYKVRAYTSWMKNFGPEYFFEKEISLVNSFVVPQLTAQTPGMAGIDVQFFPEGGDLVTGINTKVAFKAVGSTGKGQDFRGAVQNSRGDTVALLHPLILG